MLSTMVDIIGWLELVDAQLLQLIQACMKSTDILIVLKAIDIGTNIAVNW